MVEMVNVAYGQSGTSKATNAMGQRPMQARAYAARAAQFLLLKAPPAAGKSRALMYIALDKLRHQGLAKVIVCVPETSIGGSFRSTDLTSYGFEADWQVDDRWVVSRMWWKFSGDDLRAMGFGPDQATRSRMIGSMG
jgi:hypothetical protein